jgi:hypothetical protein
MDIKIVTNKSYLIEFFGEYACILAMLLTQRNRAFVSLLMISFNDGDNKQRVLLLFIA